MKVALAQINATVGDLEGNAQRIVNAARRAYGQGVHLVVAPELALTGYPPKTSCCARPSRARASRHCVASRAN